MEDIGLHLRKDNHALIWGYHNGWGRKWPYWFKHILVKIWNPIACYLWGHEWFPDFAQTGPPLNDYKKEKVIKYNWDNVTHRICINCCKSEKAKRGGMPEETSLSSSIG